MTITLVLIALKLSNSLSKELIFNPNIYMELIEEYKVEKIPSTDSSLKEKSQNGSYYDRVINNLYNLFTSK